MQQNSEPRIKQGIGQSIELIEGITEMDSEQDMQILNEHFDMLGWQCEPHCAYGMSSSDAIKDRDSPHQTDRSQINELQARLKSACAAFNISIQVEFDFLASFR